VWAPSHVEAGQGRGTGPTPGANVAAQALVARHGGGAGRPRGGLEEGPGREGAVRADAPTGVRLEASTLSQPLTCRCTLVAGEARAGQGQVALGAPHSASAPPPLVKRAAWSAPGGRSGWADTLPSCAAPSAKGSGACVCACVSPSWGWGSVKGNTMCFRPLCDPTLNKNVLCLWKYMTHHTTQ